MIKIENNITWMYGELTELYIRASERGCIVIDNGNSQKEIPRRIAVHFDFIHPTRVETKDEYIQGDLYIDGKLVPRELYITVRGIQEAENNTDVLSQLADWLAGGDFFYGAYMPLEEWLAENEISYIRHWGDDAEELVTF